MEWSLMRKFDGSGAPEDMPMKVTVFSSSTRLGNRISGKDETILSIYMYKIIENRNTRLNYKIEDVIDTKIIFMIQKPFLTFQKITFLQIFRFSVSFDRRHHPSIESVLLPICKEE
jgi:hypothetical protein